MGALSAEGVRKLFDYCRRVVSSGKWNWLRFFSLCEAIGLENSPLSSVPSVLTPVNGCSTSKPVRLIDWVLTLVQLLASFVGRAHCRPPFGFRPVGHLVGPRLVPQRRLIVRPRWPAAWRRAGRCRRPRPRGRRRAGQAAAAAACRAFSAVMRSTSCLVERWGRAS